MSDARSGMVLSEKTRGSYGGSVVLRGVPYDMYEQLVSEPKNDGLRMTYYDGTLEVMSPAIIHESLSRQLGVIVLIVCSQLGIPCKWVGAATFRRRGDGPMKGKGKEADESFYIQHFEWFKGRNSIDLDAGDFPPDLWIDVDHRGNTRGNLPVYAMLRVPEVWRFRAKRRALSFLRLTEGGQYEPIRQSLALPMLTPDLVLEAIAMGDGLSDSDWHLRLCEWARARLKVEP